MEELQLYLLKSDGCQGFFSGSDHKCRHKYTLSRLTGANNFIKG